LSKTKETALKEFRDKLTAAAQARLVKINSTKVDDLESQLTAMEKVKAKAGIVLDNEYEELVEELTASVKEIKKRLSRHFTDTKREVKGMEETRTESYEVEKSGVLSWGARLFGCGGYETRTREYTSVRTGAVMNALEEMEGALEREVDSAATSCFSAWRKELFSRLLKTMRSHIEDETSLDDTMIRASIRKVCALLNPPQLDFTSQNTNDQDTPLSARGTITGYEAEEFIEQAKKSVINMQKRLDRQIDNHAKSLKDKALSCQPAKQIFSTYEKDMEKLRQEINQLELTRSRINSMVQELNKA
jgi:hypothetical protein